jgi:hypothetical protein
MPVSPEFMTLYPEERLKGNWQKREQKQTAQVIELANTWKERPLQEIVRTISEWERQADALGRVWPRMIPTFCARLAQLKQPSGAELTFAIQHLPPQGVRPFFEASLLDGRIKEEHFKECLARPDLEGILIEFTLKGRTPDLYASLEPRFPAWVGLIEGLCIRREVSDDMLKRLLKHSEQSVRLETALYMFRSKSETSIPKDLSALWHTAIVEELANLAKTGDGQCPYDLRELLAGDPAIARGILEEIISSKTEFHGLVARDMLHLLVAPLDKNEKRALLHRCKHLVYSPLPYLLVGSDEEMYRELLGIAELKHFHLAPLAGDPNEGNWTVLAKLALAAGYSHQSLSHAVQASSYSWTGGLSTYYQQWVDCFERLRHHIDPDIQRIAEDGYKWSTALRDRERKSEKHEEVLGWD